MKSEEEIREKGRQLTDDAFLLRDTNPLASRRLQDRVLALAWALGYAKDLGFNDEVLKLMKDLW